MIIQREIEAVMLAIDELVQARIAMQVTRVLGAGADVLSMVDAVAGHRDRAAKARIAICDGLKDVITSAAL